MVIFSARFCEISQCSLMLLMKSLLYQTKRVSNCGVTSCAWVQLWGLVAASADVLLCCTVAEYVLWFFFFLLLVSDLEKRSLSNSSKHGHALWFCQALVSWVLRCTFLIARRKDCVRHRWRNYSKRKILVLDLQIFRTKLFSNNCSTWLVLNEVSKGFPALLSWYYDFSGLS